MSDDAHKALLNRSGPKIDVSKHFPEVLPLLTSVVSFGTNLVPRVFATSRRSMEDVIVACVLLKQVVGMADAFQVLVCEGAVSAASVQARSILEVSMYIDWILQSDAELKVKYYYVANLRRMRLWAARLMQGSEERARFTHVLDYVGPFEEDAINRAHEQAIKEIDEIDQVLLQPALAEVNGHFEAFMKRGKKRHGPEPSWYQPCGKSSIRQIAKEVGRLPEYDTMYVHLSQIAHGASYRDQVAIRSGNKIQMEPIRHLRRLPGLVSYTASLTLKTYESVLKHYRPGELRTFKRRYTKQWHNSIAAIGARQVQYEVSDVKI